MLTEQQIKEIKSNINFSDESGLTFTAYRLSQEKAMEKGINLLDIDPGRFFDNYAFSSAIIKIGEYNDGYFGVEEGRELEIKDPEGLFEKIA